MLSNYLLLAGVYFGSPSWWWGSDFLFLSGSIPDDPQMDSGGDGVVTLVVDLWESKLLAFGGVDGSLGQISKGSGVDHVSDDVLPDGFVFWDPGGTGLASDEFDVASAFLVTSVVSSLLGHLGKFILSTSKSRK